MTSEGEGRGGVIMEWGTHRRKRQKIESKTTRERKKKKRN